LGKQDYKLLNCSGNKSKKIYLKFVFKKSPGTYWKSSEKLFDWICRHLDRDIAMAVPKDALILRSKDQRFLG